MQEFDFVQTGRALIKDPSLVRHASADSNYVNACNHCAAMIKNPGAFTAYSISWPPPRPDSAS
jgi:2,4-dienoyl-CoA reductase-like NADH-dependent reductase (Old Yellow Enzyme family)